MSNWTHVDGKITLRVGSRGMGDDSPIYSFIADAPKITGSEGSAVFTIEPRDQFPIRGNDNIYYHEAEITITGALRDRDLDDTCEEIINFINYLTDHCDVHGDITVKEDHSAIITDYFNVKISKTFEIHS